MMFDLDFRSMPLRGSCPYKQIKKGMAEEVAIGQGNNELFHLVFLHTAL